MKTVYSYIFIIFVLSTAFANNPQFSQTPVKIPMYNGLDSNLGYPEFVDLDADGDLDVVFFKDFNGPNYPVYYENMGTDSVPQYVRDETMFAWLDNFLLWNLLDLRMLDMDNDGDYDLILFNVNFFYQAFLFENTGNSITPNWNTNPIFLFSELGQIREINICNVLGDSLPQITVITDSIPKFYRQLNDSLIEVLNYFSTIQNFQFFYNNGPTKIEFLKLEQDTSQYLLVNMESYDMWVPFYYQWFEVYKNIGSKMLPYWVSQGRHDGHCRLLKYSDTMVPINFCYSDGFWAFSLLYNNLVIGRGDIHFEKPNFWINGNSTIYTDISSFDWKENGLMGLVLTNRNLWQELGGFGEDSNFNMYLCLSDFFLDSTKINYSFNFKFPSQEIKDNDPSSIYFDFADLDADNDQDITILKASNGYVGSSSYLRIYWNSGSDSLPVWDSFLSITYNHDHWDESVNLEDIDNDGDFDLIIGKHFSEWQRNCLAFYENIGDQFNPQFSTVADTLIKISNIHPTFADVDGDGDKDIIAQRDTSISPNWYSKLEYYKNESIGDSFIFSRIDSIIPQISNATAPHLVDIDNDSDADLFILTKKGELYFIENLTVVNIPKKSETIADEYHLYQNYPNPFNSQTTIKYYLPKASNTKIEIFNVLGQKVKTLVNQAQQKGTHIVLWDGKDDNNLSIASGLYFYQLNSGEYSNRIKMLILK